MAGADLLVRGLHPSGLKSLKGSWLCDWSWPNTPGAHLCTQVHKDKIPPRSRRARHMISDQKAIARTAGFERRKVAHAERGECASRATEHLVSYLADKGAKLVISGYMPIRTEIDVLPAMEALHGAGHRICVPVIVRAGLPLSFREWTPDCAMVNGPFGAKVPESGDWLAPEVLIVPLVSFDMQGFRLGYGGGYYDRSLELLRKKKPTLAVGYAYSGQMGVVPVEATDQRLDAMVTEGGVTEITV